MNTLHLERLATPGQRRLQLGGARISRTLRKRLSGLLPEDLQNPLPDVTVFWAGREGFDVAIDHSFDTDPRVGGEKIERMQLAKTPPVDGHGMRQRGLPYYTVRVSLTSLELQGSHDFDFSFSSDDDGHMPKQVRAGLDAMALMVSTGTISFKPPAESCYS